MNALAQRKKIMLIGAGREQIPGIIKAQEMGFEVVVTDRDQYAPGAKLANYFHVVSTSDKEKNLAVARKESVSGVFTLGSETAVPVVAYVAKHFGLPSYSEETALAATSKSVMKGRFEKFNVPTSPWLSTRSGDVALDFIEAVGLPVVVKPSINSGQRGITLVSSMAMALPSFVEALRHTTDDSVVIEKFYPGTEINVLATVQDGSIEFLSVSQRVTAPEPSFGIAIEHVYPAPLSAEEFDQVKEACTRAITAIGLVNGIAYPQVIIGPEGPKVLEIAVRIPGGFMHELCLYASGLDMTELTINQAVGRVLPISSLKTGEAYPAVCVSFLTALDVEERGCRIVDISGLESAVSSPNVKLVSLNLKPGSVIPKLDYSGARFGAVLSTGETPDEARSRAQNAKSKIRISLDSQ